MAHRIPVQVVFGDVDMMGHVNNASYFTYFETARTEYLLKLTGKKLPANAEDLFFIVAKAACEYKRGLRWGERVEVVVWPAHVGTTSFTFEYLVLDEQGHVAARGETVQVYYDYDANRKQSIPDALRSALEAEKRAGPGVKEPLAR